MDAQAQAWRRSTECETVMRRSSSLLRQNACNVNLREHRPVCMMHCCFLVTANTPASMNRAVCRRREPKESIGAIVRAAAGTDERPQYAFECLDPRACGQSQTRLRVCQGPSAVKGACRKRILQNIKSCKYGIMHILCPARPGAESSPARILRLQRLSGRPGPAKRFVCPGLYRSNKRIFAAHARTQQTTVENLQDLAPRVVPEEHAPWTWTTPEGGVAPFYPPLWTLFPI